MGWGAVAERFSASDLFWWPSRQNVGSNPGRDRGACIPEQTT